MALTFTTELGLGFTAPDFNLPDVVSGTSKSLNEMKGEKGTVVAFICNHCPYVIHMREELIKMANDYLEQGIKFIAISSNDVVNYPADAPDKMKELALALNFPFPYLYDETQEVAKAYDAACTPDFAVFDGDLNCVYRGRIDGSTPGNGVPVTGDEMRKALDQIVAGESIEQDQLPSCGCNIKWKF